jgi:cystathionine beta-lyase
MQYNFDQQHQRRGTDSSKWHAYDEDVLPMWVADMDFVSPEPMLDALHKRVAHGIFGYPMGLRNYSNEIPAFSKVIIERLEHLYNWQIQPEDIVLLPGVVTGFNLACHAFAGPQESVLVQTPVYPPILNAAHTTGIQHQEMQLTRQGDGAYEVDRDIFKDSIQPNTRLFILCNPHNPVGRVFNPDELATMAEVCLQHNVIICSDEIHCDLVFDGYQHTPIASLNPEIAQNTITLMAPSKTFNIPGLQCSFAIIQNKELRKQYIKSKKGLVPWVNLMGMIAGEAAYRDGDDWLKQLMNYLQDNRDYLDNYVQEHLPGIEMALPEGTYLAWLDCRQALIEGNPHKFFLERARVAMNDGEAFGKGGEGFVRLNFGCPRAMLVEALERMKTALAC